MIARHAYDSPDCGAPVLLLMVNVLAVELVFDGTEPKSHGFGATESGWTANAAVANLSPSMVSRQVPPPAQEPPLQPVKLEVASGVAVSVTTLSRAK